MHPAIRIFICCLFIGVLAGHCPLQAQYEGESYTRFYEELPSPKVYHIMEDRKGYVWICTENGICRYNGSQFRTYTINDGLPTNDILRCFEDRKGRIWLQAYGSEPCYILEEKVHNAKNDSILADMKGEGRIQDVEEDHAGNIWLSYTLSGLVQLDTSGNSRRIRLTRSESDFYYNGLLTFPDGSVLCQLYAKNQIANDQGSRYYIDSIYVIEQKDGVRFVRSWLDMRPGREYYEDGAYYLFRSPGPKLNRLSLESGSFKIDRLGSFFRKDHIFEMHWLGRLEDHLLAGQKDGLWWLSKDPEMQKWKLDLIDGSLGQVSCTMLDHFGNLWVASLHNGITVLPAKDATASAWSNRIHEPVYTIGKDEDGNLFAGLGGGRIIRMVEGEARDTIRAVGLGSAKGTGTIRKILIEPEFSFGVTDLGIIDLHGTHKLYSGFSCKDAIYLNETNEMLIATSYGLLRYNRQEWEEAMKLLSPEHTDMQTFNTQSVDHLIIRRAFLSMASTPGKKNIYACGIDGLFKLWEEDGKWLAEQDLSINGMVSQLVCDADENIWIISGAGDLMVKRGEKWTSLYVPGEKRRVLGKKLRLTPDGAVWEVGLNGVVRWEIARNGVPEGTVYSYEEGLESPEVFDIWPDSGFIWIATNSGLRKFYPNQQDQNYPLLKLDSAVSGGQAYLPNGGVMTPELPGNNLRVYFTGIVYPNSNKVTYRYRLNGLDTVWDQTVGRMVSYEYLPAGTYTFEVQARNGAGSWVEADAQFSFYIPTPLWQRPWVISLVALLILGLISLAFRALLRRQSRRAELRYRLLEAEQQALRAQMNPHFIFNALNSIQNFILKEDSLVAYDYLESFSRLIRLILEASRKKRLPLSDELEMIRLYVRLEALRFDNNFEFREEIDPDLDLETRVPSMLFQPFLENAIWHGLLPLEGRPARLELSLRKEGGYLACSIRDNGIGRKAAAERQQQAAGGRHESAGMQITQDRILSAGAESDIRIEDLYDADGVAAGTRVSFRIRLGPEPG